MAGYRVNGTWVCNLCSHEWQGVGEAGKPAACPSCGAEAGRIKEGVAPGIGEKHVQCNCGSTLWFIIIQHGHPTMQCQGCGSRHFIMVKMVEDKGEFRDVDC